MEQSPLLPALIFRLRKWSTPTKEFPLVEILVPSPLGEMLVRPTWPHCRFQDWQLACQFGSFQPMSFRTPPFLNSRVNSWTRPELPTSLLLHLTLPLLLPLRLTELGKQKTEFLRRRSKRRRKRRRRRSQKQLGANKCRLTKIHTQHWLGLNRHVSYARETISTEIVPVSLEY